MHTHKHKYICTQRETNMAYLIIMCVHKHKQTNFHTWVRLRVCCLSPSHIRTHASTHIYIRSPCIQLIVVRKKLSIIIVQPRKVCTELNNRKRGRAKLTRRMQFLYQRLVNLSPQSITIKLSSQAWCCLRDRNFYWTNKNRSFWKKDEMCFAEVDFISSASQHWITEVDYSVHGLSVCKVLFAESLKNTKMPPLISLFIIGSLLQKFRL